METTVTGVFANVAAAQQAMHALSAAGIAAEAIEVITSETTDRHLLLAEETGDAARGAVIGAGVAGLGMAIGGWAMAGPIGLFEMPSLLAALVFGGCGAVAGLIIGLLVGSATGHQVQEEYEHQIDHGAVLLAVNSSGRHAGAAQAVLAKCGGTMLSTSVHRKHRSHAQPQSA